MSTTATKIDPMTLHPLMRLCMNDYPDRYDSDQPFVVDGYVYTTDEKIMSRMICVATDTPGNFPPVRTRGQGIDTINEVKEWVSADSCLQKAARRGLSLSCDPNDKRLVVPVGEAWIRVYYAAVLAEYCAQIEVARKSTDPIRWKWCDRDGFDAEIHGVVMPMFISNY